jgi:mannosyl-3-phosphoglycerate phosphatase
VRRPPPFLVLSDLDGCLLDRRTYDWTAAGPALEALHGLGVPLILCSSKTRTEVEVHRGALAGPHPFIVENGGAVFVPRAYFPFAHPMTRTDGPYKVLEFGIPYARLVELFREIRQRTRLPLHGFSDMTVKEVAFYTGLGEAEAERARAREYDEPFMASLGPGDEVELLREAGARGLTVVRGGRFLHLMGDHAKGRAAEALIRMYRTLWAGIPTVGLGDGANDVSLLEVVDHPVVIPRDLGTVDPVFLRRRWPVAPAPGPEGWNAEVLRAVERLRGAAPDAPYAGGRGQAGRAPTALRWGRRGQR